jgi:hypothetical protein
MSNVERTWAALVAAGLLVACGANDPPLRGKVDKSPDGKTYLKVIDNNGGGCGAIYVDGRAWSHAIGEAGSIEPGAHTIACPKDAKIGFTIPPGVVFNFNYWGP